MPLKIPSIPSDFNRQRFLKGVGAIVSIVPPRRAPGRPFPPPMTAEQVAALSWQQTGAALAFALGQVEGLLRSEHAAR